MSSASKERVLTPRGNYAVYAAGTKVIDCPPGGCKGAGVVFPADAYPGQLVFYNNVTMLSVDPSATPTATPIVFGMFNDTRGDGRVDEIIKIAGDKISHNGILSLRADPPAEGQEELSRFMYSCVKKGKLYSARVIVESDRTHKEFFKNRKMERVISYIPALSTCEGDCDDDASAREVACGLVDAWNNWVDTSVPLFQRGWSNQKRDEPTGVKLFVYNANTYHFCLDGAETGCSECTVFTGVKGVKIEGVTYTWNGLVNSSNQSHESQLKELINLITCQFDKHQGQAWRETGAFGATCQGACIAINSCKTIDGLVKYDDTIITPSSTDTHVFTRVNKQPCVNCDNSPSANTTYDAAIGAIGELAEENWKFDTPSDNMVRYYPTHVTIVGENGFTDSTHEVLEEARIPQNFGRQLWLDDYYADPRPGYMNTDMRTGGRFNEMLEFARRRGVMTEWDKPYCVVTFQTSGGHGLSQDPVGSHISPYILQTQLNLKKTDTVTIAAVLADLNAMKNAGIMAAEITDISCSADPDPGPPTPTPTRTPDATPSVTPTKTPTNTVTPTVTASVTPTLTPTVTTSISVTPTVTPSVTPSVSITPSPSPA